MLRSGTTIVDPIPLPDGICTSGETAILGGLDLQGSTSNTVPQPLLPQVPPIFPLC
jgi:hypothetical protein